MNLYLAIIIGSLIGAWFLNLLAGLFTLRSLAPAPPPEFSPECDPKEYARSQEYVRANTRLNLISDLAELALVLGMIFLGLFNALDQAVAKPALGPIWTGLAYIAVLALVCDLASLPFSLVRTFVIEERFGFNRTTPLLFIKDKLKVYLLSALIGGPIVAGVLFFFKAAGSWAWILAWGLTSLIALFLAYLGPVLILPLFNKLAPLQEGELKDAIQDYAQKAGFALNGIFIMDGSKRSSKANAFITGLGGKKRISLFDTLLDRLGTNEIVSILAHEVGHHKKAHVSKMLALSILKTGALFYLLSIFLSLPGLHQAFGMERITLHAGLVFFMLLYTPAGVVLSIGLNWLSRKHEFQADRFAAQSLGDPAPLITSLKRLSLDNLSNLTPHPFNVFLHYTHPPALQRIRALDKLDPGK